MCGIISFGDLELAGFEDAVSRRWPVTLARIDATELRLQVYSSMHPARIWTVTATPGRYQRVKLAIWPVRAVRTITCMPPTVSVEAMPMLLP